MHVRRRRRQKTDSIVHRTLATNRNSEEKWRKVNDSIYFSFVSFRVVSFHWTKERWMEQQQQHRRRNNRPQIYSNSHHQRDVLQLLKCVRVSFIIRNNERQRHYVACGGIIWVEPNKKEREFNHIDIFKMADESDHSRIDCLAFHLKWHKIGCDQTL